ncbi:MAG: tetratricopeptide repeat protein, partial [Actinomycetota bacterium]|nr:tetratricopeptide repeat protein [Actinomycetota bacterium]
GDFARAEELGRSALEYALKTDFPDVQARACLALAHVLRQTGRDDEARPLVEQAIEQYEVHPDVVGAAVARRLLRAQP